MANMAWGENAVIVKDNGNQVTFHPKCPACGAVDSMRTSNAYVRAGVANVGSFFCPKCQKGFDCRLSR